MTNIFLNSGVTVNELYKNLEAGQLQEVEKASEDGFSKNELKSLEEDGIDVSLIEDNSVKNAPIEDKATDTEEIKAKKAELREVNKKIMENTQEIRALEEEIIKLEEEINENFEKNVEKQEELEQKQKEDIKEAQTKALEKYTSKEGTMDEDDYYNNLNSSLKRIDRKYDSEFAKVAQEILKNDNRMATMTNKLATQNRLNNETDELKKDACSLSTEITELDKANEEALAAKAAAEAAAAVAQGGGTDNDGKGSTGGGGDIVLPEWIAASGSEDLATLYTQYVEAGYSEQEAQNNTVTYNNAAVTARSTWQGNQNSSDVAQSTYVQERLAGASVEEAKETAETARVSSEMEKMQATGKWA